VDHTIGHFLDPISDPTGWDLPSPADTATSPEGQQRPMKWAFLSLAGTRPNSSLRI
jgi:hypothetical protein